MTSTAFLTLFVVGLTLLLIMQRQAYLTLHSRYRNTTALVDELGQLLTDARAELKELKQHTLAHVVYDADGDPTTKGDDHIHEIAEALVTLNTDEPDEDAPILDEQRPDTSPTRVPTEEELQLAAHGRLSDKRPNTGSVPIQDT